MFAGLDISHWIMFGLGGLIFSLLVSASFRTAFFVKLRYFMTGVGRKADRENRRAAGKPPREKAEENPEKKAKGKGSGSRHVHIHLGDDDDD